MPSMAFASAAIHRNPPERSTSTLSPSPMTSRLLCAGGRPRFSPPLPPLLAKSSHFRRLQLRASSSSSSSSSAAEKDVCSGETGPSSSIGVEGLRQFVQLNLGNWKGSFYQFDENGSMLQRVNTRLSATSYGEDELISLIQTLYIKEANSVTSISGYDNEPEWVEYKIKESNLFTVDKYQQIGLFPKQKAFSLRYQTAGMLETVLRSGVLGEDDIGEESPKHLKLPSRRPSIVCENCLYSLEQKRRARAFHIMDPKGVLDMLLIFMEQIEEEGHLGSALNNTEVVTSTLELLLGRWEGRSITKRSGVYGATVAEADTVSLLEIDDRNQIIQDITSTSGDGTTTTNVRWTGKRSGNLISFDGGFQMTLLPGGMYMGYPLDISNSVVQSQSFHLEFCWMESLNKRQRLVRTYDYEGQAVSSTYFCENKV